MGARPERRIEQGEKVSARGGGAAALLRRVVMVRGGEAGAMLWGAGYFFCLLFGYYLVRSVREAMGIASGWDKLPWLVTATLVAMLAVNPVFSWIVSRLPRRTFIPWTYGFMAINLVVFFALFRAMPGHGGIGLGYVFYVWLSVFNLFAVSVFWAFMADGFRAGQAKRLFGFIAVGGTLGAIGGAAAAGFLTGRNSGALRVAPESLLLLGAGFMVAAAVCVRRLVVLFGFGAGTASREPGPGVLAGLRLIGRSRYLQLICVYIFVFTITSQLLYLEQGRIVERAFPDKAARTAAFANIDLYTNIVTLVVQVFLTARVIRWIGVAGSLAIVPALTVIGFLALWSSPTLGVLMVFQVARRGMHYALDRPARESLFTVVSADEKYKSKSFIDTAVYRAGDLSGAWMPTWMALAPGALGLPLAGVWLVVALALGMVQRRMARPTAPVKE